MYLHLQKSFVGLSLLPVGKTKFIPSHRRVQCFVYLPYHCFLCQSARAIKNINSLKKNNQSKTSADIQWRVVSGMCIDQDQLALRWCVVELCTDSVQV